MDDIQLTVEWQEGIVVSTRDERICFDAQRRGEFDRIFVSHSHSDHTAGFSYRGTKHSTQETRQIFEARYGRNVGNFEAIDYNRPVKIGSIEIVPRNAGHILGSAQFEVNTPEETVAYTGDINCVDTLTTKAATPIECDILVMETTYGNPTFVFPRREEVYVDIAKWAVSRAKEGQVPVFEVYSVGKAQEIVALINYFTELPVIVEPTIGRVNEVHKKFGAKLHFINADSEEGQCILEGKNCCYVVPPRRGQELPKNAARATVTGWSLKYRLRNYDMGFPLSSHADFCQLVSYVEEVKPSVVYTCFGRSEDLAQYIEMKTGIRSLPLKEKSNLKLGKRGEEGENKSNIFKVLKLIVVPGFVYKETWLIRKLGASGLSAAEARRTLSHMENEGIISCEKDMHGYRLT